MLHIFNSRNQAHVILYSTRQSQAIQVNINTTAKITIVREIQLTLIQNGDPWENN